MSHLPVAGRIALPEPLGYHTFFRADGRRGVAVGERTGRLWLLDVEPEARTCEANPLPITVPRREDGRDWNVRHVSGSHALDRLLLWTDAPRVFDLPSGQVLAELGRIPGRALCLSPDGRWALCLGEGSGGMMDLVPPEPAWRETTAFHVLQREAGGAWEEVYLDHVDGIVALPSEEDVGPDAQFWIAAGCYGFVSTHLVNVDRHRQELYPVPGDSRDFGGFVYDPTELLHHCWIRGRGKQPYGFINHAVPCGTAPLAWVHSMDGGFLWRVGQPPVKMPAVPEFSLELALHPDALLCLAYGGEELLWCDLPAP